MESITRTVTIDVPKFGTPAFIDRKTPTYYRESSHRKVNQRTKAVSIHIKCGNIFLNLTFKLQVYVYIRLQI